MKNLFKFEGRIGRKNFALSFIGVVLFFFTLQTIFDLSRSSLFNTIGTLGFTLVYTAVAFVALLCVIIEFGLMTRRLHDLNKSGWYNLLVFIPFVNLIFILVLFFVKGSNGENKYGMTI
jgi:uncharacterized membrane protein YhaH (DUF805 family)